MEYEAVIGLEVHVQLKTHSKMFCACENHYGSPVNSQVCPICLGMPGTLPAMNEQAVKMTIMTGMMLGCEIAPYSKFDRKNYFYPDMPKNYQISQYDLPLCKQGRLLLVKECYPKDAQNQITEARTIGITRIHLEEDVGKSFHLESTTGVDFNRAGTPLMEIVSEPDIRTPEEAFAYLSTLKQILLYGKVSDADMEKGQMRCDCNVSVRPVGSEKFGTKLEIKNMNTISGVRRALIYEIARQKEVVARGEKLTQETRRWDDAAGVTVTMRSKEMAHDYRYFPEPDLMPVDTSVFINEVKGWLPELPAAKKDRFIQRYQLTEYNAGVLVADMELANFFEVGAAASKNPNAVANWICNDLQRELSAAGLALSASPVKPLDLTELVELCENKTINSKQAKDVFVEMFKTGKMPHKIVEEQGLAQVQDTGALEKWCDEAIAANPGPVGDYRGGKVAALNFLKGQVMKLSKGKANPALVGEVLEKRLKA
ncbi:MAG: Asp-tRNA(Asn)/Glu-tRNA(Gln) amidotransferase subunit GatB [Verrucomicrobiae bacterium]|nr:Asp-tRNA(Asn)/Glu-tRNA(Gln) amidotransferase subunit GatB [Verrucomicrobiae bacterium]